MLPECDDLSENVEKFTILAPELKKKPLGEGLHLRVRGAIDSNIFFAGVLVTRGAYGSPYL